MPEASDEIPDSCDARAGRDITRAGARTATVLRLLRHHHPNLQPRGAGLQEMWPVWAVRDVHPRRADSASVNAMLAREDEIAGGTARVTVSSLRHDAIVVHDRLRRAFRPSRSTAPAPHHVARPRVITWQTAPGSSIGAGLLAPSLPVARNDVVTGRTIGAGPCIVATIRNVSRI